MGSMTHDEVQICKIAGRVLRDKLPFGSDEYKAFVATPKAIDFARVLTQHKIALIDALYYPTELYKERYSPITEQQKKERAMKSATLKIESLIDKALVEGDLPAEADLPTYHGRTYRDYMNDRHWALLRDVMILAYLDQTNTAPTT